MRTISEPARASAATCATVPSMSAVSVLVIDWTTIGAPPPTRQPLRALPAQRLGMRQRVGRAARVIVAGGMEDRLGHAGL
jgi:hypothetical protein